MAQDYKTINCTCGKELIMIEGNIITKMCALCPQKMNRYYIHIRHSQYYVEVLAREKGHARGTFMKEHSGKFDYMLEDNEEHFKRKGYTKLETLVRKYSGEELEEEYPPGHPARKKAPRRKRK